MRAGSYQYNVGSSRRYGSAASVGWKRPDRSPFALVFVLTLLAALVISSPALAAPGDLDTTFGDEGMVRKPINEGGLQTIAAQPDGKIVTAGSVDDDLVLRRHNEDGSPDTTFDGDGKVVTRVLQRPTVQDLAIQPDGKILVAGGKGWDYVLKDECEPQCFFLARYNADGSPDTTFGGDGSVATKVGSWEDKISAVALQSDGKIVAAGSAIGNGSPGDDQQLYDFALARYDEGGSLDTTFGGNGILTTPMGTHNAGVKDLSVQPDGRIFAMGSGTGLAIAHYNPDGSLDASFDGDGKLTTKANFYEQNGGGNGGLLNVEDYRFQPDGKIVLAGLVFGPDVYGEGYNYDFGVARYNADGSPDTTFDDDGKLSTEFGTYSDQADTLAFQPDGKIVVGGWSYDEDTLNNSRLALARYAANGALDTSFNGDGKALGEIFGGRGLALQPDGKILATGTSLDKAGNVGHEAVLARHYGGTDATPPGPVTGFAAGLHNGDVHLSWANPTDGDHEVTRILRSTTGYATSATRTGDQTIVYAGTGTSHVDADVPEGAYYYTAFARDDNGNWSVAAEAPVPPETTIDAAPMKVDNLPVDFHFRSSQPGSTFECRVDTEDFAACSSPKEYTNLPEGDHTFEVRAVGPSGAVDATPDSFAWTVDTQGPEVGIEAGPSGTVSSSLARFEFSSEPGATFICQLDDGGESTCGSPRLYDGLTNGQHTFSVRAYDAAGNRGPATTRTWTVAPESTSENLAAGETLTSDAEGDGATESDPMETTITSPVAGQVSVVETASTDPSTAGYSFLGHQAEIEAPSSTAEDPLRFVFQLDASLVPAGEDQNTIQVFRNGARVGECADDSGTATPDPCVLQRVLLADGDVEFTVLTSRASHWNLGVADRTPPTVEYVRPGNLEKNVSRTKSVTATFSEAMKAKTINKGTFELVKRGSARPVEAKVTYSATANKATLNPDQSLRAGVTYAATITSGARDLGGNMLDQNPNLSGNQGKRWTFKVER